MPRKVKSLFHCQPDANGRSKGLNTGSICHKGFSLPTAIYHIHLDSSSSLSPSFPKTDFMRRYWMQALSGYNTRSRAHYSSKLTTFSPATLLSQVAVLESSFWRSGKGPGLKQSNPSSVWVHGWTIPPKCHHLQHEDIRKAMRGPLWFHILGYEHLKEVEGVTSQSTGAHTRDKRGRDGRRGEGAKQLKQAGGLYQRELEGALGDKAALFRDSF